MKPNCIISLTSIPPRFSGLGPVLASLLAQDVDGIELWIPRAYTRYPEWSGELPVLPHGVRLMRCAKDYGPATKYLPALDAQPDCDVIFCDDDAIYQPDWASAFREASREKPSAAIAGSTFSVRRAGISDAPADAVILQGFSGALLRREWLESLEIGARDMFVDDVWLSAMLAAKPTLIVENPAIRRLVEPIQAPDPLQDECHEGLSRSELNQRSARALADEFRIWGS